MKYYVYMTINNLDNAKCYIGLSKNPVSSGYKGSGKYINDAIKKYGTKNFTRVDLGSFDNMDETHFWEGFYIKLH